MSSGQRIDRWKSQGHVLPAMQFWANYVPHFIYTICKWEDDDNVPNSKTNLTITNKRKNVKSE